MKPNAKPRGTWWHRFAIQLFTLVFAVLVYWLLGFLVSDIRSIPGPDYAEIERAYLDENLVTKRKSLDQQTAQLTRQIADQTEKQKFLDDSSRNLQQTIQQLLELQKLGLQKNVALTEAEQANLTTSLNSFLENQKKYQELGQSLSDLVGEKQSLERETELLEQQLESQRRPAKEEYNAQYQRHRLYLAFWQLAILLPLLAVAAVVIIRQRSSLYFPLFLAFGGATLLKVTLVMHEYFPRQYFKYILIGGLLLVVARLLVYFIRAIAFPKVESLHKQYREAYERFLCPVCEYPIRVGPRRFLFWTRRTVNKLVVPAERSDQEEPYTCPACGSKLFEECTACHKVRHALLPNCAHCGAEKSGS